jgi:hypothetical protein
MISRRFFQEQSSHETSKKEFLPNNLTTKNTNRIYEPTNACIIPILGACRNLIFGVFGIFLAKKSFQSSQFSKGIFFTWPLFSHFVINLDWLAGQPI